MAGCGRGRAEIDTLGVAQSFLSRPADPRLLKEPSLTRAIGPTNDYISFGAQPPQGTETVGAGPNVQAQPVCRDSGNRRSRTRVHSPLPHTMARKRRAISIKSGKFRTSVRTVTPVSFTVLDATIISSAPNNTNTNYHTNNAMQDLMTPHAAPAAANAAIAEPSARTRSFSLDVGRLDVGRLGCSSGAAIAVVHVALCFRCPS